MASGREKLEDLNMTQDELQRFEKAFKSEEFRKLFAEYAEEISDPENRKRYEEEIAAMERERGTDVTFINPEPHYVIKTAVDGEKKCFINICANQHVGKPTSQPSMQGEGPNRRMGQTWSVPHSLTPGREDLDKDKQRCMVYDVVFHQETLDMADRNKRFKQMVHDIAFSALERQFSIKLDKTNIKIPKMKYKGNPTATVMRKPLSDGPQAPPDDDNDNDPIKFPYPYGPPEENKEETKPKGTKTPTKPKEEKAPEKRPEFTVPKYTIKHRSEFDIQDFREAPDAAPSTRPSELVVDIDLPLLKSAAKVELDIFEKQLKLESKKPAYRLDISLPYPVDENEGGAKFDKSKKRLTVTLMVKPAPQADLPFAGRKLEDRQLVEDVTDVQAGEKAKETHVQDKENAEKSLPNGLCEGEADNRDETTATEDTGNTVETGTIPVCDTVVVDTATDTVNASDKDIFEEEDELQSSSTSLDLPPDSPTPACTTPAAPTCPEYTYRQDEETMIIVIHVPNIVEKSVSKTYSTSSYIISVQFQAAGTAGSTGLRYYQLFMVLLDGNTVVRSRTTMDVSSHNAVVLLHKDDSCKGLWGGFKAGVDIMNLEEKLFLTEESVGAAVEALKVGQGQSEAGDKVSVKVTEASEDKLAIELKNAAGQQETEAEPRTTNETDTRDGDEEEKSSPPSSEKSSIKERVSEIIEGAKGGEGLDSDDDADESVHTQGTEDVSHIGENTISGTQEELGRGDKGSAEMVQDGEELKEKDSELNAPTGKTKRRRRKKKGKSQTQDSNSGSENLNAAGSEESNQKDENSVEKKEGDVSKTTTAKDIGVPDLSSKVSKTEKESTREETVGFDKTVINKGRERKNSGKKSVTFSDKVEIHKLDEKNGKGKKKQKGKNSNQKAQNGDEKAEEEQTKSDVSEGNESKEAGVSGVTEIEPTPEDATTDKLKGVGEGDSKEKEKADVPGKKPTPGAVDALTIKDVGTGKEEVVVEHRAECAVQFTNKVMFELD